nr:rhodanese-like domain-containing protein [uncultured Desulfuromonas sp.]
MKKLFIQCGMLLVLAVSVGLLINVRHWQNCTEETCLPEVAGQEYLPVPVDAAQVVQWRKQKHLIVDARSVDAYAEGHLPSALSAPRGDRRALSKVVDCCLLQEQVLVYCSGVHCDDSFVVGEELFRAGFTSVLLYEGGFADWQQQGFAVERGMP